MLTCVILLSCTTFTTAYDSVRSSMSRFRTFTGYLTYIVPISLKSHPSRKFVSHISRILHLFARKLFPLTRFVTTLSPKLIYLYAEN